MLINAYFESFHTLLLDCVINAYFKSLHTLRLFCNFHALRLGSLMMYFSLLFCKVQFSLLWPRNEFQRLLYYRGTNQLCGLVAFSSILG